ncbi:hypothetical protein [Chromobacterium amazonense]|uniref:hypothetical protein n=1 Tax=Chromobacterium amazonense TaxID=1382803 RepID=UPI0009F18C9A|nr:hypothetical protein [Chromobacterium amazonense]
MDKIYISDTNIWIDFHHAALLTELFQLPFTLCSTDLATSELDTPDITPLLYLGLKIETLSGDEVMQLVALREGLNKSPIFP